MDVVSIVNFGTSCQANPKLGTLCHSVSHFIITKVTIVNVINVNYVLHIPIWVTNTVQ